MTNKIVIEIPRSSKYVSVARMNVLSYCNMLNLPIDKIEDIKLCVSEACNNIVLHSPSDVTPFRIEIYTCKSKIYVNIIDTIGSFVFSDYQEPNLNEVQEGGFGIFIIRSLADSFSVTDMEIGQVMSLSFRM